MTEEKTPEEKQKELDQKNDHRLDRFANYQAQRIKATGRNVPTHNVVKDKHGNLHWLNRKQRRAQGIK